MRPNEFEAMKEVSVAAFEDEPEISLLLDLLHDSWSWVDELSFVAELDGDLVGQILYTKALLDARERLVETLLLSPVGVRPDLQNQGIGSRLIRESLQHVSRRDEPLVFLEGSPDYYSRFGFERASTRGFEAPSARIPDAAFMVYVLPRYEHRIKGRLVYPDAFWRADAVGLRD